MSRFSVKDIINYQKGYNGHEKLPNISSKVQYPTSRNYTQENISTSETNFSLRQNPGPEILETFLYKLNLRMRL